MDEVQGREPVDVSPEMKEAIVKCRELLDAQDVPANGRKIALIHNGRFMIYDSDTMTFSVEYRK